MNKELAEKCLTHRKHIFNYFYKLTGFNYELSEDLTQQTFVKIYTFFDKYKINEKEYLPTWMLKVAKNILIDYLRKKKDLLECELESYNDEVFDINSHQRSNTNIEADFERKLFNEKIESIFDELPPHQKEALSILKMNVLDDLEYHKISKIVNRSNDSLRQSSKRIKKILREKLAAELF